MEGFRSQYTALGVLEYQHVVECYGACTSTYPELYLFLKPYPHTLWDYIRSSHPYTLKKALELIHDIASAVDALRHAGFTLLNLSAKSIMLDENYSNPRIGYCGFSFLHLFNPEPSPGPSRYRSPELIENKLPARGTADIYACGMICREILLRRDIFESLSEGQVCRAILNRQRPPLPDYLTPYLQYTFLSPLMHSPSSRKILYAIHHRVKMPLLEYPNSDEDLDRVIECDHTLNTYTPITQISDRELKVHVGQFPDTTRRPLQQPAQRKASSTPNPRESGPFKAGFLNEKASSSSTPKTQETGGFEEGSLDNKNSSSKKKKKKKKKSPASSSPTPFCGVCSTSPPDAASQKRLARSENDPLGDLSGMLNDIEALD